MHLESCRSPSFSLHKCSLSSLSLRECSLLKPQFEEVEPLKPQFAQVQPLKPQFAQVEPLKPQAACLSSVDLQVCSNILCYPKLALKLRSTVVVFPHYRCFKDLGNKMHNCHCLVKISSTCS